ncbi:Kelch repeat-containing protein [Parasphingorhabdus marina]|uniref:Kelch repeat-containing protein n=1 Tax=Parasphingorhabdus marina TaxID=394732 RepID=UPI0013566A76|nr:galactose oxidase [Parasphingorhabdus marina]
MNRAGSLAVFFVVLAVAVIGFMLWPEKNSEPAAGGTEPRSGAAVFSLPVPMTNNAVALATGPDGPTLYSFNGLKAGKGWQDTSQDAFACVIEIKACEAISPVPVEQGRLASAAVTVDGKIYLFGGYTVAENGDEVSTPEVFAYDTDDDSYVRVADMPTPVDDMVALPYRDRWIYLVSGWHDQGNVSLVQLYDTRTDSWSQATEFPGLAVFGHAGGLVGNSMIVTDGVAVAGLVDGKRKFVAAPFTWRGDIDPADPLRISWRPVDPMPGGPLYRMAAVGDPQRKQVIFAGGGDNPYNYNGIGYDGEPAKPSDRIMGYDLETDSWTALGRLQSASMDHRGLAKSGQDYYIMGGMNADQAVIADVAKFRIDD